jgi:hypothetical protein
LVQEGGGRKEVAVMREVDGSAKLYILQLV